LLMGGTLLSGCQLPFRQYCTGLPVCGTTKGAEMPDTLLGPEGSGHYRAPASPSGGARCSKCLSFWSDRALLRRARRDGAACASHGRVLTTHEELRRRAARTLRTAQWTRASNKSLWSIRSIWSSY
jgi:hypothetical protein